MFRFKDRIRRKHSEEASHSGPGPKRGGESRPDIESESDSDFLDGEYLESASSSGKNLKSATTFIDDHDGCALRAFYRDTLGLDVESSSGSESERDDEVQIVEPQRKRRRLNDGKRGEQQREEVAQQKRSKHSFGGLPISEDLMDKIAKYLTLTEISRILVLIDHEFCGYFNTDRFWKRFYSVMSKTVMERDEVDAVKSYQWDCNHKLYKRRMLSRAHMFDVLHNLHVFTGFSSVWLYIFCEQLMVLLPSSWCWTAVAIRHGVDCVYSAVKIRGVFHRRKSTWYISETLVLC